MKYRVFYECGVNGKTSASEFDMESQIEPTIMDSYVIELALKDSIKFHKFGLAGVTVVSIELAS